MKYENNKIKIFPFQKGINKKEKLKTNNNNSTIKISIILFFIIIHISFYLFSNNIKSLKIRKLSSDSIIIITLSIDNAGDEIFISEVKDKIPDEIYINGNDVTSNVTFGGKNGNDLLYTFTDAGEYIVKVLWHEQITSCRYMFNYLTCITKIDLSQFDSSQVVSTEGMFYQCKELKEINFENFDK